MQDNDLSFLKKYILANGPEGLRQVLDDLFEKVKSDSTFAAKQHFIMYQLGGQKSFIKVDMSKPPFQFWYNDVLGRPMTKAVEETIASFIWERCGEKERFLQGLSSKELL
ncbi:MAG: hypothetical protein KIT56_08445 [Gammaproteobacteria bacterium]|nr:hypothetical protein [Gammaproteobacteria bacterium]MCW5583889.1 hypothetical protein [Gammaproteobacteria bacterium]